jgi:acyl-CoA synthetase (NDP forming)
MTLASASETRPAPAGAALEAAFEPKGVAVIGASDKLWSYGQRPIENLVRHGFGGPIFPVNPKYETVYGLPCLASAADLEPGAADLAIVLTRGDRLPATLEEMTGTGVKAALVFSATPDEMDYAALDAAILASGIRVIGFSAAGIITPRLMAGGFSASWAGGGVVDAPIAVISQSGGIIGAALNHAIDAGSGVRWLLSIGTSVDLGVHDVLAWMAERDELAAVGVYLEGSEHGAELLDAFRGLRDAGTRVVAIKVGTSELGAAGAATHTGVVAGDDRVWDEALRSTGVHRTDEVGEMIELLDGFARRPDRRRPTGSGVLGLSVGSGGGAAMLADHLDAAGVGLARLDPAVEAELAKMVPTGEGHNPVDIAGVKGLPDEEVGALAEILEWAADQDTITEALVCIPTMGFEEPAARVIGGSRLAAEGRVTVVWMAGSLGDPGRYILRRLGVPSFERFDLAATFLAGDGEPEAPPPSAPEPARIMAAEEGIAKLAAAGVEFPRRAAVALDALSRLGGDLDGIPAPWVLKVDAPGLAHKAAAGGVALDMRPGDAAVGAAERSVESVRAAGFEPTGLVVEEMVEAEAELFLSLRRDGTFGPVAAIGLGGAAVEQMDAVALRIGVPDAAAVAEMLERCGAAGSLSGPEAVSGALAKVAAACAAVLDSPGIEGVEVNPVAVVAGADPVRLVALDAVVSTDA